MSQGGQGPESSLALARAALAALEASRARIDDLNVYPVPDGDTGTNMTETVRAAVSALERDPGADVVRAALMGARGNSGVILSQLVRGAAEALAGEGEVDAAAVARALRGASDAAYAAVRDPEEGTMLTVARSLAERAEELVPGDPRLPEAFADLVGHGEAALAATQEQLEVLKRAGVVDAGGAGVLEILRGIAALVRGEELPELEAIGAGIPLDAVHQELSRYRYCTSFFVEGEAVDPGGLEQELTALGDSLLVVGAPGAVKVHLHTDDPGAALALATARGEVEEVDIKNMHVQTANRTERLEREVGVTAAVAVVLGAGNRELFQSLGAVCVEGGDTMNPSTADLLTAVQSVGESGVVLLPNSKNVVLAAERAAAESVKDVRVVATRTLQAGLGALVAFDAHAPLEENVEAMEDAAAAVRAGAVALASRSMAMGPVEVAEGQFLGLVDGEAVGAGDELGPVAEAVAKRLVGAAADVLTILVGDGAGEAEAVVALLRDRHPGVEIEVHEGGQPHYPLLLAAE
ncbi:MAG TPA: DAK2 domain-containing protein [Gaiellaceae bacterium]|nr:DAK2 domain-containing protein [Gaiellaceae bacterium]